MIASLFYIIQKRLIPLFKNPAQEAVFSYFCSRKPKYKQKPRARL